MKKSSFITVALCAFLLVMMLPSIADSGAVASLPVAVSSTIKAAAAAVLPLVDAVRGLRDSVESRTPRDFQTVLYFFLNGASSVIMVRQSFSATTAGIPREAKDVSYDDATSLYTNNKFFYSLGAIAAEFVIIKLFYREPFHNRRSNQVNRFLSSFVGLTLLVFLIALPTFFCDIGVLSVFVCHLSSSVYVPAICVGQILKPYVSAYISYHPALNAMFEKYILPGVLRADAADTWQSFLCNGALSVIVLGAVAFVTAAHKKPSGVTE